MPRYLSRQWAPCSILVLALTLRLATVIVPSIYHPDEIYQYLEPAHRLLFGYGVVPWEYRVGMRSWVLPLLLAIPMKLGFLVDPDGMLHFLLPRIATAIASTAIVWSAWTIGARTSRVHGAVAAVVTATWYELVAISSHPLGESIGLATACTAAALLFGRNTNDKTRVVAGALLALTCIVRFQYGPAMAILAVFACGVNFRARWLPMMIGAAAMLAGSILIDAVFGAMPFGWLVENVRQNLLLHKADGFGTAPWTAYIGALGAAWGWATVPILIATYAGAKRCPALFWAAIVHFALHSFIPHKEYRFILLSSGFAILLAGIGTVDLVSIVTKRLDERWKTIALAAIVLAWTGSSAALGARWSQRPLWTARSASNRTLIETRADKGLCGIGVLAMPISELGGYTVLHRRVPIFILDQPGGTGPFSPKMFAPAFNAFITIPIRANEVPPGYRRIACRATAGEYVGNYVNPKQAAAFDAICLYQRAGGCDAALQHRADGLTINKALIRYGM